MSAFQRSGGLMNKRRAKQKDESAGEAKDGAAPAEGDKAPGEGKVLDSGAGAAFLRVQKDLQDLDLPDNVKLVFPTKGDIMHFSFVMDVNYDESYWKGGLYEFKFDIPSKYPFDGPKVVCVDKIYHPNIDLEGKVCVNVLRPWKPTYSIQIVLFGILFLFTHPNPNDPLNNEAAKVMREDKDRFKRNVRNAMKGQNVDGDSFPRNKGKGV